mgnify:CR=1 FL=1
MDPPVQVASPPRAFLAEIRPKIRLLAVGFNGQIRKGTPFSLDSAVHYNKCCLPGIHVAAKIRPLRQKIRPLHPFNG